MDVHNLNRYTWLGEGGLLRGIAVVEKKLEIKLLLKKIIIEKRKIQYIIYF